LFGGTLNITQQQHTSAHWVQQGNYVYQDHCAAVILNHKGVSYSTFL